MFKRLLEYFTKQFIKDVGRRPQTTQELMSIQDEVVRYINLTKGKGITGSVRTSAGDVKPIADPFQGFKPTVIQGGKSKEGIESLIPQETFNVKSPLVQDDALRIKQGLSTRIKLNSENENAQMVKDLILRKNKEFNSLDRTQQKEILDRIQNQIKESKAQSAKTINPDDEMPFASGGLARVGMVVGGSVWKKFIEQLFMKSSNNILQGKGLFKGLDQKQIITQHDNLTKMLKKWEMSGKKGLPEGASEYLGMNDLQVSKAIKDATKKVDKDRLATADELEEYESILDPTGVTGDVGEGMTVKELDKMVVEQKAYERHMYDQYKTGKLDPVAGEKTEARREFLQQKLDEAELSGDNRLITRDEMDELESFNLSVEDIKISPEDQLRQEFPGIDDNMIRNILTDKNPQRIAEVKQTMRESLKMQEKGMSPEEIINSFKGPRTKHASGGIAGQLHMNEGGRVPMIFGGSAGLKGLIASIKAQLNKGRKDKLKTLFPKYSVEEKELLKLGEKYLPNDAANLAAKEAAGKAEGVQALIDRLKHDKKLIAEQAKNKAKNDPNLDFLMESLEKTMPEAYGPHLKKYKNIDKDILQLETIKKNLLTKDRKLHASGGRAGSGLNYLLGEDDQNVRMPSPGGLPGLLGE